MNYEAELNGMCKSLHRRVVHAIPNAHNHVYCDSLSAINSGSSMTRIMMDDLTFDFDSQYADSTRLSLSIGSELKISISMGLSRIYEVHLSSSIVKRTIHVTIMYQTFLFGNL